MCRDEWVRESGELRAISTARLSRLSSLRPLTVTGITQQRPSTTVAPAVGCSLPSSPPPLPHHVKPRLARGGASMCNGPAVSTGNVAAHLSLRRSEQSDWRAEVGRGMTVELHWTVPWRAPEEEDSIEGRRSAELSG